MSFPRIRHPEWIERTTGALRYSRDMSLDGTMRRPARQVERTPGVRQYEFGAGMRWQGVLLEYRAITRSREYRTGPSQHAYSTMSVALVPW